ncbi:universal stress protein [Streptomyces sp. 351MFTsu5.1]|uniref:universal stress protein n=1 Tax=Streptomyces sp. 351MFTsu5.1 TaxID=1172180 RepID=UPI00035DBC74|nr:universal stress protein [Streptomyces sp. 351MFTsu5.1]
MTAGLPIVVGVDGSEPALRAVDWAADEAARRELPLRLVYASLWERYEGAQLTEKPGRPSEQARAEDVVASAARRATDRRPGVVVSTDVQPEEPEYTLIRESRSASLLVTGTRGRGGLAEALLGSVSLLVAGHAHCPVVVVRGQSAPPARARVVVGVGEQQAAVRFAAEEARQRGAVLEAVRAWRCPAHESSDHPLLTGEPARLHEQQASEVLEKALLDVPDDVEVHRRTVEGHARTVLVDASRDAGLLVLGARRRQRHFGLQLGRVAHGVLHQADCPVVIVPEPV